MKMLVKVNANGFAVATTNHHIVQSLIDLKWHSPFNGECHNIDNMKITDYIRPVKGFELKHFYYELYLCNHLFPDLVAKNPEYALSLIKEKYNTLPDVNGNNITAITEIRNLLYNNVAEKEKINAFAIVAAHTHWEEMKPVIYKYFKDSNIYIIGQHLINDSEMYVPTSFVFSKDYALPYEWTDSSISIHPNEWTDAYSIISDVAKRITFDTIPFGMSIDFRFKESLFETSKQSFEIPISDKGDIHYGFSMIMNRTAYDDRTEVGDAEQVAWHPHSDLSLGLSYNEKEILMQLRLKLNEFSTEEQRLEFLSKLEEQVNTGEK